MLFILFLFWIFKAVSTFQCFISAKNRTEYCEPGFSCLLKFDGSLQFVEGSICTKFVTRNHELYYDCSVNEMNCRRHFEDLRPNPSDFYCYNSNNEKVHCPARVCYMKHLESKQPLTSSPIIEMGCASELGIRAQNVSGFSAELEFCTENLCNADAGRSCWKGYFGDCLPITRTVSNKLEKYLCPHDHVQNICVKKQYFTKNGSCTQYSCHHDNPLDGYEFQRNKSLSCMDVQKNNVNYTVCQCYGNDCFAPPERIQCLKSNNSDRGNLVVCPLSTAFCRTITNTTIRKVVSRGCSPIGEVRGPGCEHQGDLHVCDCFGENCNKLKCFDSNLNQSIYCVSSIVNCVIEYDVGTMGEVKLSCGSSEKKPQFEGYNQYCPFTECNKSKLKFSNITCYIDTKNNTVQCLEKPCFVKHETKDLSSPVKEVGCFETYRRSGTFINDQNEAVELCSEPLCNQIIPRKCFQGSMGDCAWLNSVQIAAPESDSCDRFHTKDICVTRKWVNANRTCNEFACYHNSGEHALYLVLWNPFKENKCRKFFENEANLTVCQCTGNDCNKPEMEEVYCRISSNSSLGSLEKCPDFTTHCRTIRDSSSNKITGRSCAPVGDVSVKCEKVTNDIQTCDCLGNDCNNQTSKYCFVGYGRDCNADSLKANNEPQLKECKTNEDENCYSASFNLMSQPCYIYSCDLFENNQGITPTEWYPKNGTLGCAEKNGVIHCRHKISSERIRCYDTKSSSDSKDTLCPPYVEQCRTIFDENDKIIARGCGELNDDPRNHTGEEIVECTGNLCNGAITCYSSKLKSMTPCDFGTLNCYVQVDYSFQFGAERGCGTQTEKQGYDGYKFYCNKNGCNDESLLFSDLRPVDFKCFKPSNEELCESKMCSFSNQYGLQNCEENQHMSGIYITQDRYEACAEPFCNVANPRTCYHGFAGDCGWMNKTKEFLQFEDEIFEMFAPMRVECDRWHVKDICIHQKWHHPRDEHRVCHFYGCHHTHTKHGEELVRKNPSKADKCIYDNLNGKHVEICQCRGDGCNKPLSQTVSCYISDDSKLGSLTRCPEFTTSCRTIRIKDSGVVLNRKCSAMFDIYPDCKKKDEAEICDCDSNGCNNQEQYQKKCYVGVSGNCKNVEIWFAQMNHEPQSKDCVSWYDNYCHTTRIPNEGQLCTVFSCDYLNIGTSPRIEFNKLNCINRVWQQNPLKLINHCRCMGENCQRIPRIRT